MTPPQITAEAEQFAITNKKTFQDDWVTGEIARAYISGATRNAWISVDEPPETKDRIKVLVIIKDEDEASSAFFDNGIFLDPWYLSTLHSVTHWQPLPNKPL